MQISSQQTSSPQTLAAMPNYSCGGIVAIIACAVFAAMIVSSALVLAHVIALSIPTTLLIVAIAVSTLALGRLCCYIHKSLCVIPSKSTSISQEKQISDDPLSAAERKMLGSVCSCEGGCTFKPGDILNQDEQLVLNAWCINFYERMNACMAKKNDDPKIKHINQIAIKALAKLPPAPNQQSLIRAADFDTKLLLELYPVGQKFTLDRFMSTTAFPEDHLPWVALGRNTRFYVKGLTGKLINLYGCKAVGNEEEVLFAPGTQFLTTQIKLDTNPHQVFLQEVAPEAIL